jgi:hypothetical protein
MTPDMNRLCEAADKAGSLEWHIAVFPEDREDIIRAVLLALRELSYEMIRAADYAGKVGDDGRMVRGSFDKEVAAMIDCILTEPALA